MRALVFDGPGRLQLRDWPQPAPGPGEVVVRVHTATICGTDVRIVAGRKTRDVRLGYPIGHECSGVVASVGDGVTKLASGDRVAVHPVVTCGVCESCRTDRENLCPERITLGYHTDGSFAEFMLIPARAVARGNLFKLPPEIPLEVASALEPAGCCINGQYEMGLSSAERAAPMDLLIIGAGPIGLLHLMLARSLSESVSRISVIEPQAARRETARLLGADETIDPADFKESERFDAVILAAGVPDMVNTALRAARKEGRVSLFAGFDSGSAVPTDLNAIHYKQLHVTGASESRRRDFAEAMSLTLDGKLDLASIITHRFPLEQHEAAFHTATNGSALKVAFQP